MSDNKDMKIGEQPADDVPSGNQSLLQNKPRPTANSLSSSVPDDMEEALTWLEQLAARQGVSVDELAAQYPDAIELSFPELGPLQADELPEWLKEVPPAHRLREFPSSAGEAAALDDVPNWLLLEPPAAHRSQEPEAKDLSSELDSRLDWLAEMGKKDEMAEMPTVRWHPDDLGLAGPALPTSAGWNESDIEAETKQGESYAEMRGDAPEDLDQAMAWLEELATSQDTPLEELPSVADYILASRIMAESGAELEEERVASIFTPTFSAAAFADADDIGALDAELDAEPIELTNFPDDLNEAMDYLDKLAAVRQRSQTPVVPEIPVVPALPPAEDVLLAADEITTDDSLIEAKALVAADETITNETTDDFVLEDGGLVTADEATAAELALEADVPATADDFVLEDSGLLTADEATAAELELEADVPTTADDRALEDSGLLTADEATAAELTLEADVPTTADDFVLEESGLMTADEATAAELALEAEVPATADDRALEESGLMAADEATAAELALEADEIAAAEFTEEFDEEAVVLLAIADVNVATDDVDEFETAQSMDVVDYEAADVVLEADTSPTLFSDPLELALINLDRLSLPPEITLESLNEAMLNGHTPGLNGHNGHDDDDSYDDNDLDNTLLWLEQQLDAPTLAAPLSPLTEAGPELDERPNELMLEMATLDETVVAELTADMPDDPDEALTWLMSLADEVEEPRTQPEMGKDASPVVRRGVRVYDAAEQPGVERRMTEQSVLELSVMEPISLEAPAEMPVETGWVEPALPELVSLTADEMPEMPDDPDEAIAWIEQLAALEEQGNGGAEEWGSRGAGETTEVPFRGDWEILVGERSPSTFAGEDTSELAADYSLSTIPTSIDPLQDLEDIDNIDDKEEDQLGEWYELEASTEVTSLVEMEASEVDEGLEPPEPEPVDESEPEKRQQITRQPHERWLDRLQPPPWTQKG